MSQNPRRELCGDGGTHDGASVSARVSVRLLDAGTLAQVRGDMAAGSDKD